MTTVPFGRGPRDQDPLLAQLARLPRNIAPPRDLWPAVAARLSGPSGRAPRPWRWPAALAAGLLIAAISALMTWSLLRKPAGETMAQATALPVRYGPHSPLGAAQLVARDELLGAFRARLGELPPATREIVVRNLAVIQRAADEIDAALADDPASALLNGLLLSAYQQELEIYAKVVAAGDVQTRSS